MAASSQTRLTRVRSVYRFFAPFYAAFRRIWGRWTRSSERALDELFIRCIRSGARILELGPGTGVNLERLERLRIDFGSYVGIDASPAMLARARARFGSDPRVDLRLGDVSELLEAEGRFDFVVSTWVLAHVGDPAAVVSGAIQRLSPGGSAVFLFSGRPRPLLLRAILRPFYRSAEARFVDPAPLCELPELERIEYRSGGLATLCVFRATEPHRVRDEQGHPGRRPPPGPSRSAPG